MTKKTTNIPAIKDEPKTEVSTPIVNTIDFTKKLVREAKAS